MSAHSVSDQRNSGRTHGMQSFAGRHFQQFHFFYGFHFLKSDNRFECSLRLSYVLHRCGTFHCLCVAHPCIGSGCCCQLRFQLEVLKSRFCAESSCRPHLEIIGYLNYFFVHGLCRFESHSVCIHLHHREIRRIYFHKTPVEHASRCIGCIKSFGCEAVGCFWRRNLCAGFAERNFTGNNLNGA